MSKKRLGRNERARVKRHHQIETWCIVAGVEISHFKGSRKHAARHSRWLARRLSVVTQNTQSAGDQENGQPIIPVSHCDGLPENQSAP